jgi:hypothetical protein
MAGYPKIFNIEMDPHEDLNVVGGAYLGVEPARIVLSYAQSCDGVEALLRSIRRERLSFTEIIEGRLI